MACTGKILDMNGGVIAPSFTIEENFNGSSLNKAIKESLKTL